MNPEERRAPLLLRRQRGRLLTSAPGGAGPNRLQGASARSPSVGACELIRSNFTFSDGYEDLRLDNALTSGQPASPHIWAEREDWDKVDHFGRDSLGIACKQKSALFGLVWVTLE